MKNLFAAVIAEEYISNLGALCVLGGELTRGAVLTSIPVHLNMLG
jgi:hypothetical protein